MNPLHLAASLGYTDIVGILLQNRADIDSCSVATGDTALHLATSGDHIKTVQLLLHMGASVNKQNNDGRTCLMIAARHGHLDMCQVLLSYGAKKGVTDIRGNTALLLHCTNIRISTSVIEVLSSNAVIDTVNWDGWWPLLAVVSGTGCSEK